MFPRIVSRKKVFNACLQLSSNNPINFLAVPSMFWVANARHPTHVIVRAARSHAMTSPTIYRSSTLLCRRHPLRSTRLHPRPLTARRFNSGPAFHGWQRARAALHRRDVTRRDATRRDRANGTQKSTGATCPSSAVLQFYSVKRLGSNCNPSRYDFYEIS